MKRRKLSKWLAGALALFLILGSVSLGFAETSNTVTTNQVDSYEKPLPRN
ncbi:hypothetical protein [Aminipila sp.]|nr:hypothetical protein [Aminipila sp.]